MIPATAQPGDLVFCHGTGTVARAIQLGQWLRYRQGYQFNHVQVLDAHVGGTWTVIQAEGKGVTRGAAAAANGTVVALPDGVNRASVLAFARAQVGRKYGFVTIASIVLTILIPGSVSFMLGDTWICSALAAESLRCGGWIHNWPAMNQVTPSQLYAAL